jgi:hypothetical protein
VPSAEDEAPSGTDEKHSGPTLVTGIWHVSSKNSNDHTSTIIIEMQGEVQYEAHRLSSPERIYFDLHDTTLAPGMFGKSIEIGDAHLARVRIAQPAKGISRVVLETTGASGRGWLTARISKPRTSDADADPNLSLRATCDKKQ